MKYNYEFLHLLLFRMFYKKNNMVYKMNHLNLNNILQDFYNN